MASPEEMKKKMPIPYKIILILIPLLFWVWVYYLATRPDPIPRPFSAPPNLGPPILVNVNDKGELANGESNSAQISGNGRYVVFHSDATNLVKGDTNKRSDIFLRDVKKNTTTRISISSKGVQANQGSDHPAISHDGRYIAFESWASNLGKSRKGQKAGSTTAEIFLHDRQTGKTTQISFPDKGETKPYSSTKPVISADGRFTLYQKRHGGDFRPKYEIHLHDAKLHQTTVVPTTNLSLVETYQSDLKWEENSLAISADGKFFAVASEDIYSQTHTQNLKDHSRKQSSRSTEGVSGDVDNLSPSLSGDGRYVAFSSFARNFSGDDDRYRFDIFLHDHKTGTTTLISPPVDSRYLQPESTYPSISADGNFIVFEMEDRLYDFLGDENTIADNIDIFLYNINEKKTYKVSPKGDVQNGLNYIHPSISADGKYIVFESATDQGFTGRYDNKGIYFRQIY